MKKRHFVLVLSAIAMASVAFGCKPEPSKRDSDSEAKIIATIAPEDRIIAVLDTLYDKLINVKDCNKLEKDLESYCEEINADLSAAMEKLMPPSGLDKESAAIQKLIKTMKTFDGIDNISACADTEKIHKAFIKCIKPLVPVVAAIQGESEKQLLAPEALAEEEIIDPTPLAKTPEDRIIVFLDTLHGKMSKATDCDKLVKDLDSYCKGVNASVSADMKILMPASDSDLESPAFKKIEKTFDKFDGLEKTTCGNDFDVKEAFLRCIGPLMPDSEGLAEIEDDIEDAYEDEE